MNYADPNGKVPLVKIVIKGHNAWQGELLPGIQTPVQLIFSRRDDLVPPINGEYLHERLPNSKLDILDTGHYPWEDVADQYAAIISAWVMGGYQNTGA